MNKDQHTIAEHHFKTTDKLHTLYVQEWGNPNGKPILFLHGGPGDGCNDSNKTVLNPKLHRVIFLDQRGAGKSTPTGSLEENNTGKLIEDLEMIRQKLNIDSWVVTGNSWGSTLAICYGIEHPNSVKKLVVGGIWLQTKEEEEWLFGGGWRDIFPELWERFVNSVPAKYRDNPAKYHFANALDPKSKTSRDSLFELINIEYTLVRLDDKKPPLSIEEFDESSVKIEMYYLDNNCFLPENHILKNIHKLKMPVYILHSRYDMICPPASAYKLHKALPNSLLTWTLGGHSKSRGAKDTLEQTLKMI